LAGIALIAFGLLGLQGTSGIIVAVIGAVPLLARLFDFCVFAPLFGCPLSGPNIRAPITLLVMWKKPDNCSYPIERSRSDGAVATFRISVRLSV
jgi:hypothetical protein